MREMARALLETDALRDQEDHENNELVSEALSWFRRLNEEYPKEEYKEFVRRLESGMPRDQV